ncbi:hypothetical protein B0H14DRAFT_2631328 [Mycena olivaceomarginata]|nr:hypothetical protein B0H14DRAFT_2631328 [Mycena olivaceomarginata]
MVGAKWLFLIYFGYRAVGYHSPEKNPFAVNCSPPLSFTPECEAGLEALNANADHEKVTIGDASTTLEGADAIHGLAGWSEESAGGVGKGKKRANTTVWDEEAEKIVF